MTTPSRTLARPDTSREAVEQVFAYAAKHVNCPPDCVDRARWLTVRALLDEREAQDKRIERLQQVLEARSRQFHLAEKERTIGYVGNHGSWMGRTYNDWEECPGQPCASDRRLLKDHP